MAMNQKTMRRIIRLDGRNMTDRLETHRYLMGKFNFPTYYGRNLDALYDFLTETRMPLKVILTFADELKAKQGDYGEALIRVFEAAARANPHLLFEEQ